MKTCTRLVHCLLILIASASLARAQSQTNSARRPPSTIAGQSAAADSSRSVKVVAYDPRAIARISTELRFTTLIILPKDEVILDYVCGDKDLWVVNGEQNFAYVKPTQEHLQTNLNLVTASGNVYSFLLAEVSGSRDVDLKVFVELKDPAMREAVSSPKRLVSAQELEMSRQELEAAKTETERAKAAVKDAAQDGVNRFLSNVRFPYAFAAGKKPFYVRAMYHDEHFTYIHARPEETPTLYEIRDGKPNLVNFEYEPASGRYIVTKVLDSGYLALGKRRLAFTREE